MKYASTIEQKCVCSIPLKTGTTLVLWMYLILAIAQLISTIVNKTGDWDALFVCKLLGVAIFAVGSTTLAIHGIYLKNYTLLLPYLLVQAVQLSLLVSIILLTMAATICNSETIFNYARDTSLHIHAVTLQATDKPHRGFWAIIITYIHVVVDTYFTLVVFTFYNRKRDEWRLII